MRILRTVLIAAAVLYATAVAALWAFQRDLMYFPDSAPRVPPTYYEMLGDVQEVLLTTADAVELTAWYVPAPPNRPTIAVFHGNAGSLRRDRYRLRRLADAGMGVLLLSYRGYSGNAGTPTEEGLYADARAGLDWLKQSGVTDASIVLYGISLGSGVATKIAAERQVGAVVLEAPYTSTVDVAALRFPMVPVTWLLEDRFESLARIAAITEPVLIMHGDRDTVIPQELGRRLFEAANMPKEGFWPQGLGHSDIFDNGGRESALDFIRRAMKLPAGTRAAVSND